MLIKVGGAGKSMDLEGCLVGGVYEVKRRLQSGYFGVTWLAENKTTNRDVCLKVWVKV